MIKKRFNKTVMLVIITMLISIQFSACDNKIDIEKTVVDHVYRPTKIDMPVNVTSINNLFIHCDRVNFIVLCYDENDFIMNHSIISFDKNGQDMKNVDIYIDLDQIEGYDGGYLSNIYPAGKNRLFALVNLWKIDSESEISQEDRFLLIMDENLQVEKKINIKEHLFSEIEDETFYINRFETDKSGNIYISYENYIFVMDEEFEFLFKISIDPSSWVDELFVLANGNVAASIYVQTETRPMPQIFEIDFEQKEFSKPIQVNTHFAGNIGDIFFDFDNNVYYSCSTGIYSYDFDTDTSTELLNWINSDMENPVINKITAFSKDKFIFSMSERNTNTGIPVIIFSMLDGISPEDVIPKYVITLGALSATSDIKKEVISFNRNNNDYRIRIIDYYSQIEGSDYQRIIETFNNDIIAGNLPDIVIVNEAMPFDSYVSKGIFHDIYKFMDNDREFDRNDYFTNIIDAYSVNGKLYSITPGFLIETVTIKSKYTVPGTRGWTMEEFKSLMAHLPDGTQSFSGETRSSILRLGLRLTMSNYIDKNTGKCNFDTPEFLTLLKFAATFDNDGTSNIPSDFFQNMREVYKTDNAILNSAIPINFRQYLSLKNSIFFDDITFIGFPVETRKGSAISSYQRLAISAKSHNKEGAWEFVKHILGESVQNEMKNQWPLRISSFDKMAEIAMESQSQNASSDLIVFPIAPTNVITQQEVDYIKSFIESVDVTVSSDQAAFDIIMEEAEMFFAGAKNAEETAKIIQSRMRIYISEGK